MKFKKCMMYIICSTFNHVIKFPFIFLFRFISLPITKNSLRKGKDKS